MLGVDEVRLHATGVDELRHFLEVIRTEDEVDERCSRQEAVLLLLRDTTRHADARAALHLEQAVASQRRVELVLGLLPDRASVHQYEVGRLWRRYRLPTRPRQGLPHALRIGLVHLTAERVDEIAARHGRAGVCQSPRVASTVSVLT